jgi:Flp pilus assembly protein TadD
MDKKNDIALLQVETEDAPFLEVTQSAPIPLGSRLAVIGNPLGKEGVLTEGKLNLKGDWQDNRNLVAGAPTAPGSSGSPAINYRNEVVGIVKATSVSTRPICIIVPGEHLRGMLARHPAGSANRLTEFGEINWGTEYKIRLDPDYQQGVLYCAAGDYTNGFKALSRVNERFPNNAELLLRLGSCALAQNQVLDALRILRQSASLNPEEPWVWCYIGQAHFKMQEQDEAIESFGRAVKLQDDLYEAWLVRGSAYAAKGNLKEAMESFEKAATINPDDVTVWNALGQCHMHMDQRQKAVSTMEKAVQIAPDNVLAWELLIAAYTKNGQTDRKWDAEKKLKELRQKK